MLRKFFTKYRRKKILFINALFAIGIIITHSNLQAKELVIALVLDTSVIKTKILPSTKKQNVVSQMSSPTHLTVMWLKNLPSGTNAKVSNLQHRLQAKTNQFFEDYENKTGRPFKVVVEKVEKGAGGHIPGGIYLLPTTAGNQVLTNLILDLKNEVLDWKSENPTIPVDFYQYFSGSTFLPHVTVLETLKANSIFPTSLEKKNYGQQIEATIQDNKPQGFGGVPIPISHSDWWVQ